MIYLVSIQLPSQSRAFDLREYSVYMRAQVLELYSLVLTFCRNKWPNLKLVASGGRVKEGLILPRNTLSYGTATSNGIKYGAYTHVYGKNLCYAYSQSRQAVRIEKIFSIEMPSVSRITFALVRNFRPYSRREMPWSEW